MFKRIAYEEWHAIVPIIAFVLTFAVFVFFVVRALRLHKTEAGRLAAMPLEDGTTYDAEGETLQS